MSPRKPGNNRPRGREPFSARRAAWRTLEALDDKHPDAADLLDEQMRGKGASDADRRLATRLVMDVLRHRGRLDWALSQVLTKPLASQRRPILEIMRVGAGQILHFDQLPDHAIVNETVEVVRRSSFQHAAGLVNGVLRNLIRRRDELKQQLSDANDNDEFETTRSCPEWIARKLDDYPVARQWRDWWRRAQEIPLPHLRVNTLKTDVATLTQELTDAGYEVSPTPAPDCIVVSGAQRVADLPCFQEGHATVQDASAAMIAHLLAPQPDERIVDFCAAPGGKTCHIAALTGNQAQILATDSSGDRLGKIPETVLRLGVERIRIEIVTEPLLAQFEGWADAVLVDGPCTGMGTIRRHPEIRWLRADDDVNQAWLTQRLIIHLAARLVKVGGRLLYSTCTLFGEENQRVIDDFIERHPTFRRVDLRERAPEFAQPYLTEEGAFSTTLDASFAMDGFFAGMVERYR